jgi:hypothetical protein
MQPPSKSIRYLMLLLPTAVLEYDFGKPLATKEKLYLLIYLFRNADSVIDKNGSLVDSQLRCLLGNRYRTYIQILKDSPFNVISDELWSECSEYVFESASINKNMKKIDPFL